MCTRRTWSQSHLKARQVGLIPLKGVPGTLDSNFTLPSNHHLKNLFFLTFTSDWFPPPALQFYTKRVPFRFDLISGENQGCKHTLGYEVRTRDTSTLWVFKRVKRGAVTWKLRQQGSVPSAISTVYSVLYPVEQQYVYLLPCSYPISKLWYTVYCVPYAISNIWGTE